MVATATATAAAVIVFLVSFPEGTCEIKWGLVNYQYKNSKMNSFYRCVEHNSIFEQK